MIGERQIIWQNDKYSVDLVEEENGISLYVHQVVGGAIRRPLGYVLGSNALHFETPKSKTGGKL